MMNARRSFGACMLALVVAASALAFPATASAAVDYSPSITGAVPSHKFAHRRVTASMNASVSCTSWTGTALNFRHGKVKPAGSGTSGRVSFHTPHTRGVYNILLTCNYGNG